MPKTFLLILGVVGWSLPALADSDGYVDNWQGSTAASYSLAGAITKLPPPGGSVKDRFDTLWSGEASVVCSTLQQKIEHSSWYACDVPSAGELRGRVIGILGNRLDIKYLVPGIHFAWAGPHGAPLGSWSDPRIDGTMDLEIKGSFLFESSVDGTITPGALFDNSPVHAEGFQVTLQNGHLWTDSSHVEASRLRHGEALIDMTTIDLSGQVVSATRDINHQLHQAAKQIYDSLVAPAGGLSRPLFGLSVTMDPSAWHFLNVQFSRDNLPSSPTGCHATMVDCDDAVTIWCDKTDYRAQLRRGSQTAKPVATTDWGWRSSLYFGDSPKGVDAVDYYVCNVFTSGDACAGPIHVVLPHIRCAPPGSRGGGVHPQCVQGYRLCNGQCRRGACFHAE
jgi:hypothetical protein